MNKIILLLIFTISSTCYTQGNYDLKVKNIVANKNGSDTFYLARNSPDRIVLKSSKLDVQSLMSIAFFREAIIDYDIVVTSTDAIQRVKPFEVKSSCEGFPFPYPGNYRINRLATQRDPEGIEHLEVFILSHEDEFKTETAYNIFECNMKQLLEYIFLFCSKQYPINFDLRFDKTGKYIEAIYIIGH